MTCIAEDGMEYKCKTEYWKTLYPIRENETIGNYSRRIKEKLFPEYCEKIRIRSREYIKHKYHTNEEYKNTKGQKLLIVIINIQQLLKMNYFLNPWQI